MQQKRDPDSVSQLLTQIRELQCKADFLPDAREFHDPESGSSSGQSHVPNQHRNISSSRRRPSCDSEMPRNTRDDMSIRGNVFEDPTAQIHPKEFFKKSKNLATSSSMTRKDQTGNHLEKELSQEHMNTIPCFQRRARCKSHEGGNYHSLMTGVQNHASGFGMIRDIKYRTCILATYQTLRNSKAGK